jgi:phosphopantetheinyl transferase
MLDSFYIGLSWMSSLHTQTAAERREKRSAEGLRILALLDTATMPLASPGEAISHDFIVREPGLRPYFSDYHADFNISHSRNMVVAAVQMKSEKLKVKNVKPHSSFPGGRVGCDVQYCSPSKSFGAISPRFFHAGELAYITADPAARVRNFYRIWVLKEAWLKLYGLSVFDMAKVPEFSIGGAPTGTDKSGLVFFLYELSVSSGDESYMLAVARQRTSSSDGADEPEIRWFSDATLTLKRVENVYAAQSPENTVIPKM